MLTPSPNCRILSFARASVKISVQARYGLSWFSSANNGFEGRLNSWRQDGIHLCVTNTSTATIMTTLAKHCKLHSVSSQSRKSPSLLVWFCLALNNIICGRLRNVTRSRRFVEIQSDGPQFNQCAFYLDGKIGELPRYDVCQMFGFFTPSPFVRIWVWIIL